MKKLQEIEARNAARTPGRWFWDTNRRFRDVALKAPQNGGTIVMDFKRWGMHGAQPRFNDCSDAFGGILRTAQEYGENVDTMQNPNAEFIAAASEDIPYLLAEVQRLTNKLAEERNMLCATIGTRDSEMERLREENERTCTWTESNDDDEGGVYDTICGNKHLIYEGDLEANGMLYCCYCGGRLAA